MTLLQQEIDQLTAEIEALLNSDQEWREAALRLHTISGIGLITTAWLLTAPHCFARCDTPQQAAAYVSLAPHARDQAGFSIGLVHMAGAVVVKQRDFDPQHAHRALVA